MNDEQRMSMRHLTYEERANRLSFYYDRIVEMAKLICNHSDPRSKDRYGHGRHPCPRCVRSVAIVTKQWHQILMDEAVVAASRARAAGKLPMLAIHNAYEAVSAQLNPDKAKASEGYGPL